MTEVEEFVKSLEGKSTNTIKAYKTQYKKLHDLLGKDIKDTSQKTIIETINDIDNSNSRQALLNIGILIRTNNKLSVDELLPFRDKVKKDIRDAIKANNVKLQDNLPTYNDLLEYLDNLKKGEFWRDYIINYLLIYYNVRNEDLLFKIVERKRDTTDTNFNYIWLSPRKAVYIRNVYKTAKTYGQKIYDITDKPFLSAIRQIIKQGNHDFIPNQAQLGYYIRTATLTSIGSGNYNKIIVNHYRNNIDMIKQISERRGTCITTLLNSYDIEDTE